VERRRWHWWAAFAIMAVLLWIRLTGYALVSWILLGKRYAAGALLALGGWSCFNYWMDGDPLAFLRSQKEFGMPEGFLPKRLALRWESSRHLPLPILSSTSRGLVLTFCQYCTSPA
jgi:hypothetical protein